MGDRVPRPPANPKLLVKLAAAAMLVVTAAAVTVGVAGATLLRGYLRARDDRELRSSAAALAGGSFVYGQPFGRPNASVYAVGGISVEIAGPGAAPLADGGTGAGTGIPVTAAWISRHVGRLVTVAGPGGRGSWRVIVEAVHRPGRHLLYAYGLPDVSLLIRARPLPGLPGVVVVGMNVAGIGRATRALVVTDLRVTLLTVLLLAGAAGWFARAVPAGRRGRLSAATGPRVAAGSRGRAPAAALAGEPGPGETIERAVAQAAGAIRTSLSVIHGFGYSYRHGRRATPASLDSMMGRVADEADRMAAAVDRLSQAARRH
jgi:signal transduction histidine kinase